MTPYALGLDLGPTSIGWAVLQLDDDGEPVGLLPIPDGNRTIHGIGVRIFPAGVEGDGKNEKPRNRDRREARGLRRTLRRRRGRKLALRAALQKANLLPTDPDVVSLLMQDTDPLALRVRGLDQPLEPFEFGRALIHLTQRRGFKSNRRQAEDDEEGKVLDGIKATQGRMAAQNAQTIGELFFMARQADSRIRLHNAPDNYHWSFSRAECEIEFNNLWYAQRRHHPTLLTEELRRSIRTIIFRQIPFELSKRKRRKTIGHCTLERHQPRCPLSSRLAQELRILQQVNDLRIRDAGQEQQLTSGQRAKVIEALSRKEEMTFDQLRKLLQLNAKLRFNFEYEGREELIGNQIDSKMAGIFKTAGKGRPSRWEVFEEKMKADIWQAVLRDDDAVLQERAQREWGLDQEQANKLSRICPPAGYLRYSEKALKSLLPHLRDGLNLHDARCAAGYRNTWNTLQYLPLPDSQHGFSTTNPIVRSAMFQVRRIVNSIIRELGKPERIVVELVRDMKASRKSKDAMIKEMAKRKKERQIAKGIIAEHRREPTDELIAKYRLWVEMETCCPYCERTISLEELLDDNQTEVDHILPYSHSLDNSFDNKVVCHTRCNREKGERTPKDWLAGDSERWTVAQKQIARLGGHFGKNLRKYHRFFMTAAEIPDQLERQLRDTAYLEKSVADYLRRLYKHDEYTKVITTKGGITAQLRRRWGLDKLLNPQGESEKNREDHRHHAIDAAVVAATSARLVKRVTEYLKEHWVRRHDEEHKLRTPTPWKDFWLDLKHALQTLNVSHRVTRRIAGPLHLKTIYGPCANGKFAHRVRLINLTAAMIQKIPDAVIRDLVEARCRARGIEPSSLDDRTAKIAFKDPLPMNVGPGKPPRNITRVRIHEEIGTPIVLGNRVVQSESNHHVEIVELTSGKKSGRREGMIVSMYKAAQRQRRKELVICREHGPDRRFVMSLSINETVRLNLDDGTAPLYRVQKMDINGSIIFRPITFAGKMSDRDKPPLIIRRTANTLRAEKVTVDPLGRIREAHD